MKTKELPTTLDVLKALVDGASVTHQFEYGYYFIDELGSLRRFMPELNFSEHCDSLSLSSYLKWRIIHE